MNISVGIRISILLQLVKKLTVVNAQPHVVIIDFLGGVFKEDKIFQFIRIPLESFNVVLSVYFLSKPLRLAILGFHNPIMLGAACSFALGASGTSPVFGADALLMGCLFCKREFVGFDHDWSVPINVREKKMT